MGGFEIELVNSHVDNLYTTISLQMNAQIVNAEDESTIKWHREVWTFMQKSDATNVYLKIENCPNCSQKLKISQIGSCGNCHNQLNNGALGWVLYKIEKML